jgi:hypothetical protein
MAFIGVRISWLTLARNALLARLAASAASRAAASSRVRAATSASRLRLMALQGLLDFLAFGDVAREHHEAGRLALGDPLARDRQLEPMHTLGQVQGKLATGQMTLGRRLVQGLQDGRGNVGRHDVGNGSAEELFRRGRQQLGTRRVVVVEPALGVDFEHQVGNRIEGGLQLVARVEDLGFLPLVLGDVLRHPQGPHDPAFGIEFELGVLPDPAYVAADADAMFMIEPAALDRRAPGLLNHGPIGLGVYFAR